MVTILKSPGKLTLISCHRKLSGTTLMLMSQDNAGSGKCQGRAGDLVQVKPEESTDGKIIICGRVRCRTAHPEHPTRRKVPLDEVYQKLKDKQVVHRGPTWKE